MFCEGGDPLAMMAFCDSRLRLHIMLSLQRLKCHSEATQHSLNNFSLRCTHAASTSKFYLIKWQRETAARRQPHAPGGRPTLRGDGGTTPAAGARPTLRCDGDTIPAVSLMDR